MFIKLRPYLDGLFQQTVQLVDLGRERHVDGLEIVLNHEAAEDLRVDDVLDIDFGGRRLEEGGFGQRGGELFQRLLVQGLFAGF